MKKIPRGIVQHSLRNDLRAYIESYQEPSFSRVSQFEEAFSNYIGVEHAIAFPLARMGIFEILKSLKLEKGDEVLMPPITIKAILDVVLFLNLKPVFVDIDSDSLFFDIEVIKSKISSRTKVVLATYLWGFVGNIEALRQICDRNELFLIEDFSQCVGGESSGKKIGSFGDASVYSTSAIKDLDLYGGAVVCCKEPRLHQTIRSRIQKEYQLNNQTLRANIKTSFIRNVATSELPFNIGTYWLFRVLNAFGSDVAAKMLGERSVEPLRELPQSWFFRFLDQQNDLGMDLLESLEWRLERRIQVATRLRERLQRISPLGRDASSQRNTFWQYPIIISERDHLRVKLLEAGFDSSAPSLLLLPSLETYGFTNDCPNASRIFSQLLLIPCFYKMSVEDADRLADTIEHILG